MTVSQNIFDSSPNGSFLNCMTITYRCFHNPMKTGTAGCSREIQDADITTGILATSIRPTLELKLFSSVMWEHQLKLFLPFFRCEGSKIIEAFRIAKTLFFKNCI